MTTETTPEVRPVLRSPPERQRKLLAHAGVAIDTLRACSPTTLHSLATELVVRHDHSGGQESSPDSCDARAALAMLLRTLAAISSGEL
jgi:hypothetical protein